MKFQTVEARAARSIVSRAECTWMRVKQVISVVGICRRPVQLL